MSNHGHVKLPPSYYANDKMAYSDWAQAWFREAIQNEMDAGADRIDFTVQEHPDDPDLNRVICHGNGCGMDEDRLFNAFLTLGGSMKEAGNIGGFGQAKVILAFAHAHYHIETQGIQLSGTGGDYTWSTGHAQTKGVKLTVDMAKQETSVNRMINALNSVCRHSLFHKPLTITLNGEVIEKQAHDHPYSLPTTLGKLSFKDMNHGDRSSFLWVRMGGLAMFTARVHTESSTAFEGYLDLDGDSKDMLTSNRDSLKEDHRASLNKIIQQLSNDREQLKLSGDIDFRINERALSDQEIMMELADDISDVARKNNITSDDVISMLKLKGHIAQDEEVANPFDTLREKAQKIKSRLDNTLGKIPENWYPDNFKVKYLDNYASPDDFHVHAGNIVSTMNLQRTAKMAVVWNTIVNALLSNDNYRNALHVRKLSSGFASDDMEINTGFIFGSPEALNLEEKNENRISIMLNPQKANEEGLSVGDLIDLAHHELTHLMYSHGESFSIKEITLRRITRNEIGEKSIINEIEQALGDWRNEYKKAVKHIRAPKQNEYEYSR